MLLTDSPEYYQSLENVLRKFFLSLKGKVDMQTSGVVVNMAAYYV
jgi:hypothetical protein